MSVRGYFYLNIIMILLLGVSECARILGVVPTPSYSHQIVFRPLWRELAKRGHEVVIITTDPEDDPTLNITQIDMNYVYHLWNVEWQFIKHYEDNKNSPYRLANIIRDLLLKLYDVQLSHPEVVNLIRNETEHFDLVLVEIFHPVMFSFANRFDCPCIGISSMEAINLLHAFMGTSTTHPVAYPDVFLPFEGGNMNFWQRLASTVFQIAVNVNLFIAGVDQETAVIKKHFETDIDLNEMITNLSMAFVNTNSAFLSRPLGPNVINIGGGFHLKPPKPLSKDLQILLDNATEGAIYFSLGTNVLSGSISDEMKTVFIEVFKEFPMYKFLWKFDAEVKNLPENVHLSKWFPQQDVLNHPNIKAFITQGGLQSVEEAIFSNVPMIIIPFLYDQTVNALRCARKGLGIKVDTDNLSKEALKKAILEIVNNSKYKENAKEMAVLIKDQPMTGLEQAVWWSEYVIRHKGARHFRSKLIDLPFYQAYLLDVIAFLVFVPLLILYVFSRLVNKYLF